MWLFLGMVLANPIPIYRVPFACLDPRFPTIYDGWIVGCNPKGMVAKIYHIESMRVQDLSIESEFVGVDSNGHTLMMGRHGVWDITQEKANSFPRIKRELTAPPAGKNDVWAYTTSHGISILTGRQRQDIASNPRGWYPPAWWGKSIVWVEDDGQGGEDLWIYTVQDGAKIFRGGQVSQRHPVALADRLAWIEGARIGVWSKEKEEPSFLEADVVDRLALDQKRLCWSERGDDIDIHCDDGFSLSRPGHQIWPALWKGYLIFREGTQLMLYRFED